MNAGEDPRAYEGANGGLGRDAWIAYLGIGALLAIYRVSLDVWWVHLATTHQMTATVNRLLWCLRPESLLAVYTAAGDIRFGPQFYLFWGSVVTIGSFIMATPILLVGWLRRRR